jgi:uncharacterized membrane protein
MDVRLMIALAIIVTGVLIAIYTSFSSDRLIRVLKPYQPETPLQVLDRRLASGEISAEEYQYERYLLEEKS